MKFDLCLIYEHMLRSRRFEEAVAQIWQAGRISGEMHLSTGEEAVAAGTVLQLNEGDAMALDHRGTAPLVMRGVDLNLLLREFLGHPEGHFLGDPLIRMARHPLQEMKKAAGPLLKSVTRAKGGGVMKRTGSLGKVSALMGHSAAEQVFSQKDPLKIIRRKLKPDKTRLQQIEQNVNEEIRQVVKEALKP